jgi:hypothetical protein
VIADIQSGEHSYVVATGGSRVRIVVVTRRGGGTYLRTGEDDSQLNNLDLLPAWPLRRRWCRCRCGETSRTSARTNATGCWL